jgi:hypothetical protein
MGKLFKSLIVIMLLFVFVNETQAQKVNPKVKSAFHKMFPTVTTVTWGKENAHEYEAEFRMNGRAVSANYTLNGKWVETETDISRKELPLAVSDYINSHYSDNTLSEIARTQSPQKIVYEVGIKKGEHGIILLFNIDGKLIGRESNKEND